jgi:predicted nucleic acid-binding protein
VRFAIPPNDPRVAVLVGALDREDVPAAETWRRVAEAGERLGLTRPSYQHVRRLVRVERRRRELRADGREVLTGALTTVAAGRVPSAVWTLQRLRELEREGELVSQEHKAFERRE